MFAMFTLLSTKVSWNVKRLNYYIDHETEFTFFFNKHDYRNPRKNNEGYEIHWFLYEKSIKENTITPNFTRLFYTENLREKVADHKKFSKSLWIFFLMSSETSIIEQSVPASQSSEDENEDRRKGRLQTLPVLGRSRTPTGSRTPIGSRAPLFARFQWPRKCYFLSLACKWPTFKESKC